MKSILKRVCRLAGLEVRRIEQQSALPSSHHSKKPVFPPDFHTSEISIIEQAQPNTMTSVERLYALIQTVRHLESQSIEGAFVECGVWRGGSMAAAALTLLEEQRPPNRELYLYDTFEGMSEPGKNDKTLMGSDATAILANQDPDQENSAWCKATLDIVKSVLEATHYPQPLIRYIKGKVEDTIPNSLPEKIALLRLDTDWYESTLHELTYLYPRLTSGGVIIIDDYGHWQGARKATDEYFSTLAERPLLLRIDYTARLAIKP